MAVRFDADEQYTRTLTLGSVSQFAVCAWIKISVDRNDFSTFWDLGASSSSCVGLQTQVNGTSVEVYDTGGNSGMTAAALTVGTWYYFGVNMAGVNGNWRYRAAGDTAYTAASWTSGTATVTGTTFTLGDSSFLGEWLNGCLAGVKLYTGANLTDAELDQESWTIQPQRWANLRAWYPFPRAETTDYSGLGNTLSGGATTATEDGPGVSWGRQNARRIYVPDTPVPASPKIYSTAVRRASTW